MYVRDLQLKSGEKFKYVDVRESPIKGFVRIEFLNSYSSSSPFDHFEIVHYNKDLIECMVYEQEWEGSPLPFE